MDSPLAQLPEEIVEWFGVAFSSGQHRVEGVGTGNSPDWAGRRAVSLVSFEANGRTASAVTRIDDLQIRTSFDFDRQAGWLLGHVSLTNRGSEDLFEVIYSREFESGDATGWTFPSDVKTLRTAPESICRLLWEFESLPAGATRGLRLTWAEDSGEQKVSAGSGVDVPLGLWTNGEFPNGLPVGETNGISFGDFDRDGFIDVFACQSANLWRNVGGANWELAADLDNVLPFASTRYGSSFGDYNNDGYPDIGTEPRNIAGDDSCFHLLYNLGGTGSFVDVATNPAILDEQPCGLRAETICWGDVDEDGDLDMFLPTYPPPIFSPGNFFLHNLGPTGPGGAYRFTEAVDEVGLDNPPGAARPEGAQFADIDRDGDLDLYSNGTLYQNLSAVGEPFFAAMSEAASGIGLSTSLDEGAMFFDYDLDGDEDLVIVYTEDGVRIWESYGDGMFFAADQGMIDSPFTGLNLGMSAEDWDNDGDIDFTTRQVFRRNMFMEEGVRHFTVAQTSITPSHKTSATPAWGDWDLDGDLDCALGNYQSVGHFYENVLYDQSTSEEARRYVRIRVVRESNDFPAGLETEFGAAVEIQVAGDPDGTRRRKFVASGHGYLNQNEYTLHFALPDDPAPGDPEEDVRFDVIVDFPSVPELGTWRVDRHVNPALGDIDLSDLLDREIVVLHDGTVRIDDADFPPLAVSPRLVTTTGGLALAGATTPLPAPVSAPNGDWYVGIDFTTETATESIRVTELILEGQLGETTTCGGDPFNVIFWDVTDPENPEVVSGGEIVATFSSRNRRHFAHVDVILEPNRHYRAAAHVAEIRATDTPGPVVDGPISVLGGLTFWNPDPCSGDDIVETTTRSDKAYLALRVSGGALGPTDVSPIRTADSAPTLGMPSPNPFQENVALPLNLAQAAHVHAAIYDVVGRQVRVLHDGTLVAGTHNLVWDGQREDGVRLAPGRYYLRTEVANRPAEAHRITLLR